MAKKEKQSRPRVDRFMSDILRNQRRSNMHYDSKANWLLGSSGVILGFSFSFVKEGIGWENIGFGIIFFSGLLAFLLSLLVFLSPKFFKSTERAKNLMFFKSLKVMTAREYSKKIKSLKSEDEIIDQYAADIMNLYKNSTALKIRLIKWPIRILFFGVLIGSVLVVAI